jgi:hypothetical protein
VRSLLLILRKKPPKPKNSLVSSKLTDVSARGASLVPRP